MHNLHNYLLTIILSILCVAFLTACSEEDDGIRFSDGSGTENNGGGNQSDETVVPGREADLLEVPKMLKNNYFVKHYADFNGKKVLNYCLEYDPVAHHSRWVAFRFDGVTSRKEVGRKDHSIRPQYPQDPELPSHVALRSDLSFRGYDHGHLCASADRLFSREGNDQTFYMSNMSPQKADFNQNYWVTFELFVQDLARDKDHTIADTLYVVKGGTITNGQTLGKAASGQIVIPKYYYMALLAVKNRTYKSIGFLIEHKDYGYSGKKYAPRSVIKEHAVSIDELEKFTGIDFFHNLPDVIENAVEKRKDTHSWGLN